MKTRLQQVRHQFGWSQDRVIRELRKRAQLAQVQLGSDASLKATISRHENGQIDPGPDWQHAYRLVYGVSDEELGFASLPGGGPVAPAEDLAARLSASRSLSASDVERMRQQVEYIRTMDRQLGAPAVLEQLRALIDTMEGLLAYSLSAGIREGLATVLADASALAGWQALDLGTISDAWDHYEDAKTAARESGSPALLAHAQGEQAFALLDLGQPAQAAELIGEARSLVRARGPRLLTAWLHAAEAEAYAAGRDDVRCRKALDAADAALPPDTTDPALPFIFLSEEHLARWRGNCLARIGDAGAVDYSLAALEAMDSSFTRAEAGLRCDLAEAMLIRGDRDQAVVHTLRARELALRVGSIRQRRRIDRLASLAASLDTRFRELSRAVRRARSCFSGAAGEDVQQPDQRARAEDLALADQPKDRAHRNPADPAGLFSVGRLADVLRAAAHVQLVRGIHHADHRLEGDQMGEWSRAPAGLLLDLTGCRRRAVLTLVHDATRQLPAPRVADEPVPPQHQHLVVIVEHGGDRDPLQAHDMVLEPAPIRRLDVDQRQPHPRVVVDGPLTIDLRTQLVRSLIRPHKPDTTPETPPPTLAFRPGSQTKARLQG
jgi:DNA-binding XRE family transcriptional regulator